MIDIMFLRAAAKKNTDLAPHLYMTSSTPLKPDFLLPLKRNRRISREAGSALEIIGHAIQYLIDEHVHEGSLLKYEEANLEAIGLLKDLNRQIYLDCPEMPSFRERCRALLFEKLTKAK